MSVEEEEETVAQINVPSVLETAIVRITNDAQDTAVYPGQLVQGILERVVQETVIVTAQAIVVAQ